MTRRTLFGSLGLLLVFPALTLVAADDANTFLDPVQAGLDYAVQGEYLGDIPSDQGPQKLGVQIVALGEGRFHAVAFEGGLPGDGYLGRFKLVTLLGIYPVLRWTRRDDVLRNCVGQAAAPPCLLSTRQRT